MTIHPLPQDARFAYEGDEMPGIARMVDVGTGTVPRVAEEAA
jgi:hypothetical protein